MDGVFIAADIPEDIKDAIACVTKVFEQALASGKHQPGDWRQLTFEGLFEHFEVHVEMMPSTLEDALFFDDKDDLENAACRVLMLLQLREEARRALPNK